MDAKKLSQDLKAYAESYRNVTNHEISNFIDKKRSEIEIAHDHIAEAREIIVESGVATAISDLFGLRRDSWKAYKEVHNAPIKMIYYDSVYKPEVSDNWVITFSYEDRTYHSNILYDFKTKELTSEVAIDDIVVVKAGWTGMLFDQNIVIYSIIPGEWMKDVLRLSIDIENYEEIEEVERSHKGAIEWASKIVI